MYLPPLRTASGTPHHVLDSVGSLAFSAALWLLVIKHADTRRDARGTGRVTMERAVVAGGTEARVASQHKAA